LRRLVFAAVTLETLIYFAVLATGYRSRPGPNILTGLTVMFFFVVIPAFALAWFRHWLPFAVLLVCITAFMWLSLYVGGQISN
jgi:hypothetical protein